jgi:hypothetical protein
VEKPKGMEWRITKKNWKEKKQLKIEREFKVVEDIWNFEVGKGESPFKP